MLISSFEDILENEDKVRHRPRAAPHQPVCFGIGMDWALPMAHQLRINRLNKPFDGTEQQQSFL